MSAYHEFHASTYGSVSGEHPRAGRADEQRRAAGARGPRQQLRVARGVELALEVDVPVAQQRPDDRERLLEPADAVVEGRAEGGELDRVPAGADAQHEPAAGDLVDGRGLLGEHERRVERGRRHERADA